MFRARTLFHFNCSGKRELVPETFAFDPRVAFPPKLLGSVGDFCAPEQQHGRPKLCAFDSLGNRTLASCFCLVKCVVLLLVGPPGSGKTHFCHHYVSNHIRIFNVRERFSGRK